MKLKLVRKREINYGTIGVLFINDVEFCDTLEDKIRQIKIKNETCIDAGIYQVIINYSMRFKKKMPLLVNVPKFEGIRIHAGNTIANTSGCILLGINDFDDRLIASKIMFDKFFTLLEKALVNQNCIIEIVNEIEK